MAALYPDLAIPIRNAIIGSALVMDLVPQFGGGDNVYTRRPVPLKAPFPMIVISTDLSDVDKGGLTDQRLSILRDIAIYGINDTPINYRAVEEIARQVRNLFHRVPSALIVDGWKVVQIWARGPMNLPADNSDMDVARNVELRIELSAKI